MDAELAAQLSPGALSRLGGTDLEYDNDKLEELAAVVVEEQEAVVRAHVGLGLPWVDALVGKTLRSPTASVATKPQAVSPPGPPTGHRIERRKVVDLKPNRFNATLFPDSLSPASIALLADDLARNGQRVPGEVTADGTIVDCERRWRAAKLLGWEEMEVTIVDGLTDDAILDRVLDSCTSVRQMTIREQVNVYTAVGECLKRDAGRQQGRPEKTFQNRNVFLTPRSIRDVAAKRAGFSSAALAVRAEAVFKRGSEELQAQVREGTVSISAAYEALPKPTRTGEEPADTAAQEVVEPTKNTGQTASDSIASAPTPVRTVSPDGDLTVEGDAEPASGDTDEGNQADEAANPTEIAEEEPQGNEETNNPGPDLANLDDEQLEVGVHVSAVCQHLSLLAGQNYEDAVAWFEETVEEMRTSLGKSPDLDGDDQSDEEEDFDE